MGRVHLVAGRLQDGDEGDDALEVLLHDRDRGGEPVADGFGAVDGGDLGDEGRVVEGVVDRRVDERVLAVEDAEDRALGDPGGPGDLLGAHGPPLSRRSGSVAAMIEARRSSGAMAGARGVTRSSMSE